MKTTSEPLETTASALEMQQPNQGQQTNTVILNPALHSAAGNLSKRPASVRPRKSGAKPPDLVLTKDSMLMSSTGGPHSAGGITGMSPSWKVTFPDIEIHSPKEEQIDNLSISSRGTSSTVGYRCVIIPVFLA